MSFEGYADIEIILTSALIRIADALETLSTPYLELLEDVRFNQEGRRFLTEQNQHLRNKIAGHKAAYTKLKNKIQSEENHNE